jgi:creatinine amidohydrolase
LALDVLSELVRNDFRRIIVMSGHSGSSHMAALRLAAQEVIRKNVDEQKARKVRVMVLSDFDFAEDLKDKLAFPEGDGHAGAMETARIMDIAPETVKTKGEFGVRLPSARFEVVADPERFFPNGVNGDPTKATAEKGKALNEYIITEVAKLVEEIKKE